MMISGEHPWRLRTWVLLILGVIYLTLVMAMFAFGINLAADRTMQYALHITVILSAFAYLMFADAVYNAEEQKKHARPALIFAALFTVPVLLGRGIGIAVISTPLLFSPDSVFNFYATVSVTRTIEMTAWTVLFPMSMAFFSRLFFKKWPILGWLCALSAICCFIAFLSLLTDSAIPLFIGIIGWGVLFIAVIIAYLVVRVKEQNHRHQSF